MKPCMLRSLSILLGLSLAISTAAAEVKGADKQDATSRAQQQLAESMRHFHWGMSAKEVLSYWKKHIRNQYRKQFMKMRDVTREDDLRQRLRNDLQTLHKGYVRFNGAGTGWESSFLHREYMHNNGEAMLVVKSERAQHFYFFVGDRLYKWYQAFNTDLVSKQSFAAFLKTLKQRYGQSQTEKVILKPGAKASATPTWHVGDVRVRAVNETAFYGFYGLVFEHKPSVKILAETRPSASKRKSKSQRMVEMIAMDSDKKNTVDLHNNIVDRITGTKRGDDYKAKKQASTKTDEGF